MSKIDELLNQRNELEKRKKEASSLGFQSEKIPDNYSELTYDGKTNNILERLEIEDERNKENANSINNEEIDQQIGKIDEELKDEKAKLQVENEAMEKEIANLTAERDKLENKKNEVMFQVFHKSDEEFVDNYDEKTSEIEQKIIELNGKINDLNGKLQLNKSDLEKINEQIDKIGLAHSSQPEHETTTTNIPKGNNGDISIDDDSNEFLGNGSIDDNDKVLNGDNIKDEDKSDITPDRMQSVVEPIKDLPENVVKTNQNNLPIRSFWEIYNDTNTEHVGSVPYTFYQMAHAPLWKWKGEDTLGRVLNVVRLPLGLVGRVVATIPNMVAGTDKKIKTMRENVKKLSQEEFSVLVDEKSEYRDNSKDGYYLSPKFMKEAKANNAYLQAVYEQYHNRSQGRIDILNKYKSTIQSQIDKMILESMEKIGGSDLEKYKKFQTLKKDGKLSYNDDKNYRMLRDRAYKMLTDEQKQEHAFYSRSFEKIEQEVDEVVKTERSFDDGMKEKTGSFKNIAGWFVAKFNPDNRVQNKKIAKLAKARREAYEIGDSQLGDKIGHEMRERMADSSHITQVGTNENNKIDRGAYSYNEYKSELLDKGPQDKTKLALASVAIGTMAYKAISAVKHMQKINTHNQMIREANEKNQNIRYSGTAEKDVSGKVKVDDTLAKKEATMRTGRAAQMAGEHGNLDKYGRKWTDSLTNPEYHEADKALHAKFSQISSNPSYGEVNKLYNEINPAAAVAEKDFSTIRGDLDYDGLLKFANESNGNELLKLFNKIENGIKYNQHVEIPYQGTVAGQMVGEMGTYDYLPDIALLATLGYNVYKSVMESQNISKGVQDDKQHSKEKDKSTKKKDNSKETDGKESDNKAVEKDNETQTIDDNDEMER